MSETIYDIDNYTGVLADVLHMAWLGKKPSEVLRYLVLDTGIKSKVQLIAIFRNSFNVSLGKVTCIGGWWHDESAELDDERIDELLKPIFDAYVQRQKTKLTR